MTAACLYHCFTWSCEWGKTLMMWADPQTHKWLMMVTDEHLRYSDEYKSRMWLIILFPESPSEHITLFPKRASVHMSLLYEENPHLSSVWVKYNYSVVSPHVNMIMSLKVCRQEFQQKHAHFVPCYPLHIWRVSITTNRKIYYVITAHYMPLSVWLYILRPMVIKQFHL